MYENEVVCQNSLEEAKILSNNRETKGDLDFSHVLVAEDNNSNRRLICLMLKRLGCKADIVSNGP